MSPSRYPRHFRVALAAVPATTEDAGWDSRAQRPDSTRDAGGADQSDVADRCFVRFACMLTPRLHARLTREAMHRGCSEAALVRDLIDKGLP